MEEVSNNSVIEEVATQETQVHEEPKTQEIQEEIQDDRQERNWKAARHRITDLEKELKRRDDLIERVLLQSPNQQNSVKVEDTEEPDEEYISKGKVKKVARREIEPLEKKLEYLEKQIHHRQQLDLINGLRKKYSDFDEVVNGDTLSILEEREPELASSIEGLKDPYKIGMQSYMSIKALGLMNEVSGKRRAKEMDKKLEQNSKTVQSPQAFDKRPMAQAFRISNAEKASLYEEMMRCGSMASSVPDSAA